MVVACALAGAGYLLYRTLDNASLFFLSVERAVEQRDSLGSKRFQLHGTPVPQSIYTIERNGQTRVIFNLAGNETTVRISHTGDPPDLFQPCVPVVLHGNWQAGEIPGDSRPAGNQSAANQSAGGQVVDDQPAGNVIAGGEPGTAAGDAAGAIAEFHFESDRILVKHDNEYRQQDSVYPSGADPNSPDPASPDPGKLAASNYNSNHGVATLARLCPNS